MRVDALITWLAAPAGAAHGQALVLSAAEALMASLRAGHLAPGVPTSVLEGKDGGKMFGVLAVRTLEGRVGFLKAFSGQLDHTWDVEGFVPPVFDRAGREAIEPRGEASIRAFTARVIAAQQSQ